jgi:DNA-directed RNA polymerase specialized sigma24 family protein
MGEFYVSYFAPLVNFFAFLTAGDDLVEELISDTMLKAWRESTTIGKTASVSVWIMGIAYSRGHAPLRLGSRALEILLRLAPLKVPPVAPVLKAAEALDFSAIELCAERASASQDTFADRHAQPCRRSHSAGISRSSDQSAHRCHQSR